MAVLFVRALGVDAAGKGAALKFSDADKIADYAKDSVGAAVELGLISGNGDGSFNPNGNAERQAVALVASKFLKVVEETATAKLTGATAVDSTTVSLTFSKEATEVKAADVAVKAKATGAAVTVSTVTLSADKKSATVKLSANLAAGTTYTVAFGGKTVEFTTAAKTEVTAVTALNLKQVKVELSGEVDATAAETLSNYTLTNLPLIAGDTASLQEDGKTVIITLGGTRKLTQQGSYSLKVAGQKDKNNVDVAEATKTFTAFDNTVPTAKEVSVVGPNTLKVTFSAPLQATGGTYALDNGSVSVTPAAPSISGTEYSVTLTVGANLAEGQHTLKVSGQTGFNDLKVTEQTLNFTFAKDTVAPTVSVASVKLYNNAGTIQSKAVFEFSEPVALNNATFYAVYNNVPQYQSVGPVVAAEGAKSFTSNGVTYTDKVEVTFGQVFPTGNLSFYVNNASETDASKKIQDAWGNTFTTTVVTASHSVDNVKPVANSAKVVTVGVNKFVELEFSENVDLTTASNRLNYTFKKTDGTLVTGGGIDGAGHPTGAINVNGKKVQIQFNTLPAGNVSVTVANVKDLGVPAQNTMDEATLTFSVVDNTAPTVSRAIFTADKKMLYVHFSKAMDVATITDLNNYMFTNGGTDTVLSSVSGATATALPGNTGVVINFSTANSLLNSATTLSYGRVKDAQGNYAEKLLNTFGALAADTIGGFGTDIINVKAVANDTITFEVKHTLSGIDASRIQWNNQVVGQAYYVNQKVADNTVDGALVTIRLANGATADHKLYDDKSAGAAGFGLSLLAAAGSDGSALTNVNGNGLAGNVALTVAELTDAIAPKFATNAAATHDTDGNGKIDAIFVSFSESMKASTISLDSFSVNGYTVLDVQPVNATNGVAGKADVTLDNGTTFNAQYKIVVKEQAYNDGLTNKPTVNLVKAAKDVAGNDIAPTSTGITPVIGIN